MREKTRRVRETARREWEKDPARPYRDVYATLRRRGILVSWPSFAYYHGPAVRRRLGIVSPDQSRGRPRRTGGNR